jgi:hypothetical protein
MIIDPDKIAILTTVSNFELYQKSINTFPAGITRFVVDGTRGFYGIRSLLFSIDKLKNLHFEWLIMADEDVIFKNPDYIYDLIDYMNQNDFICCGMRDGGTLSWRNQSPYAINTFFSVLNIKEVSYIFDKRDILRNQYIKPDENIGDLTDLKSDNFDKDSLFEGYYCFYFWLLRQGKKILYLDATSLNNDETTIVFDHKAREILYHTWYARFYQREKRHTERIDRILDLGKDEGHNKEYTILKNPTFEIRLFFYTYIQRISRHWNQLVGNVYRS